MESDHPDEDLTELKGHHGSKFFSDEHTIILNFRKKNIIDNEFAIKIPSFLDNNEFTNPCGMSLQLSNFKAGADELTITTKVTLEATQNVRSNLVSMASVEIDWEGYITLKEIGDQPKRQTYGALLRLIGE